MKNTHFLFLLVMLCCFGCSEPKNEKLVLNEKSWQFSEYDALISEEKLLWKPASVPGSVQTDLLRLGEISHPFLLNNEDSIQWVSEKDWVYKTTFSVPKKTVYKKHHILVFEGLDTYAQVFFNETLILTANNAFRTWEVNVSSILKAENTLKIVFSSVDAIEKQKASALNYQLPEAPRVFTRKPQFQYGWDWGPKIKTMGVWRPISLLSYDAIRVKDAFIETNSISEEKALLTAHIEVETFDYDKSTVEIINNTTQQITKQVVEVYGNETLKIPFKINQPKLWWTHNLGEPFLYDVTINLKKGNTVIASVSKKVGVRNIELITEKDSIGARFYFKLNGKPVFMKGANYIPQNIFLTEVSASDSKKLVEDVVAANMNMLRVWGGGVYEDNLFYDLCDEKGVLIWQDFMFACAMYPGDTAFLSNVKQEAIDNVKRLRQHPSIALWCGNNENREGWHRWGWQAQKTEAQKSEIWDNYKAVFNNILPKVIDSLHPSVSYWESSPKYGRGDKRYQFEGDAHDWWVWHDGYPFEHFETAVPRFMSEFGFQSFPSYETIQYFTQQDTIDLNHSSFATHQKHSRGFQLIKEYMERDFPVPQNAEDYVYVSQLLQAYGITKGIRAHRKAKPYNMGTLYWQLNDCWPVVSWSSIDGLGNWKALHYKAKRAFKNTLPIAWEEQERLKVTIVEDSKETKTDSLQILIKNFKGRLLKQHTVYNVATNSASNNEVASILLSDFEMESETSFAEIRFGEEKAVHFFEKPKNLNLPKQEIDLQKEVSEGILKITVSSKTLQKDVFLYTSEAGHFSDNFFDLLPGEERTITFTPKDTLPDKILYKTLNGVQQNLLNLNNDL